MEEGNIFTPSISPHPPEWTNVGRDKWSVILGGSGGYGRLQEGLEEMGGSKRVK